MTNRMIRMNVGAISEVITSQCGNSLSYLFKSCAVVSDSSLQNNDTLEMACNGTVL